MRDAFLQLLRGEQPAEIVWCADLTYWADGNQRADLQDEAAHARFCRDLGALPYFWYGKFWAGIPAYDGVEVREETRGPVRRQTWRTATGSLTGEWQRLEGSWSEAPVRHPVESEAELDVLLDVLARRQLVPANLDDYPTRLAAWARHDGVPCLGLPRSPLPALFTEWTGVQHGALLALDCPAKVAAALDLLEDQEAPVIEAVCQLAPPVVHFPDNLSSDNLTPFFDAHMAERYRRRIDRLHAAGIACAVHLDGAVRGLLPKLAAVGFDAIEAVTPAPCGDVTVDEMRALAGNDRVILWGGVPGAMFAPPFTWPHMRAHVEHLLECWRGTRFIVGVADQVPPNGDIGFVSRIAEVIQHG